MSKLRSVIMSCKDTSMTCPELPGIALALGHDGADLMFDIAHIVVDKLGVRGKVLHAEQVRLPGGIPRPELFFAAADPGPTWCEECRAAFGYATLATAYATLAMVLRPDIRIDFSALKVGVDQPPPLM